MLLPTNKGSHKNGKIMDLILNEGGERVQRFLCFFGNYSFVLKTSRNAVKHMTLSFKMQNVPGGGGRHRFRTKS